MKTLPVSERRFDSVEQLDALPRELGWPLEYRQIEPGSFSSVFTDAESDTWFLMEEQSSRRVEVSAGAPDGMVMMAIVEGDSAVINGQPMCCDRILMQMPGSDIRAVIPARTKATQIGISEELARDIIDAVAPDLTVPERSIGLFSAAPGRLESLRWAMRAAILTPSSRAASRDEAASGILAEFIAIADDLGKKPTRQKLHRASARRALHRAREYIEGNIHRAIRVSSVCSYSGTSLRSLERIFVRDLGVPPQQYVMARRLNAVRRRLLAAEPDEDLRVTDVAQDFGFTHLGRFAGDYRRFFGESPRDTLLID